MERIIKVSGMHCKSCEMLLSDVLSEIKGVSRVSADSKKNTVSVSLDDDGLLDQVKKAIQKEGYKVLG